MSHEGARPTLRDRIRAGELLVGTFLNIGSPIAAEACAAAGFDWVLIDLEHGSGSEGELLGQLMGAELGGAAPIVRVESDQRMRISRALDIGAAGIMVPRVDTADIAQGVVDSLRYPPDGIRGVALMTRARGYGNTPHGSVRESNEQITGIVQIESPAAVEAAADIAAIDGVDVLFVGPTDLTHSMGIPGQFDDPAYVKAAERVASTAVAAGKAAGILVRRSEEAADAIRRGYRFIGIGSDSAFMATAARAAADSVRASG